MTSTFEEFAPRGVAQLAVLEDEALLLCLSDGRLTAHTLPSLAPAAAPGAAALCRARSVNMFHWDASRGVLCVATKRSLLLYRYDDSRSDFAPHARDLAVPERVQCVGWAGDGLCLGFKREYVMLNIATGALSEVFPTGRAGSPSAMALPPDELLLTRDAVGVPVSSDGKATRGGASGAVQWTEPPCALAACPPFAAALLPTRGVVELRAVPKEQMSGGRGAQGSAAVQTISVSGSHILVAPSSMPGCLIAASTDAVTLLRPVPVAEQVAELTAQGAFTAALLLCDTAAAAAAQEDGPSDGAAGSGAHMTRSVALARLRCDVHRRLGFSLFDSGDFTGAMSNFTAAGSAVAVTQVLALFPDLVPPDHPHRSDLDGRGQALSGARLGDAMTALLPYLQAAREAVWQQRRRAAADGTAASNALSEEDLRIVDTATVRALLSAPAGSASGDALMRLLLLPNAVDVDIGERCLTQAGRHAELVALYRSRGRHTEALNLLGRLGRAAAAAASTPAGGPGAAASPPSSSPFGPRSVVEYLLAMKPQDVALMLQFSVSVLADSPSDGLALFTRATPPLGVDTVLPHLRKHAPQLCAPYLEAELRSSRGSSLGQEYHNALVLLRQEAVSSERAAAGAAWDERNRSEARVALLACLSDSRVRYSPERLLSRFPLDAQAAERALLLRRLGRHTEALRLFVRPGGPTDLAGAESYADEVWQQQQQQEQETQQIQQRSGDDGEDGTQGGDVYVSLLQVLLDGGADGCGSVGAGPLGAVPHDGAPRGVPPQMLEAAISLLTRRADRIDGARAMALLPSHVPLGPLLPFFTGALRSARERRRQAALERALRRRENMAVREALAAARARHVHLVPERMCALCPGRIGGAVFAVFPDNRVAHYTCYVRVREEGSSGITING